jgi:hypothetical protein
MDIEKLNKSQIVLLTLLVSFVTSIATGIVTVSLMQQAPPSVAETVNRVIEHTIEATASSTPKGQSAAAVVTQQKTVIVNESDLIAQAVKLVSPSIVRVYTSDPQAAEFLGMGIVVDASGTVAADIGALGNHPDASIELQNGTSVHSLVTSRDTSTGLLYLTPSTSTAPKASVWTPATLASSDAQLGESIVTLSGQKVSEIAQGLVTLLLPADDSGPEIIDTDIPDSSIMPGSALINTNGDIVGVSTGVSRASSPSGFVPASLLATYR